MPKRTRVLMRATHLATVRFIDDIEILATTPKGAVTSATLRRALAVSKEMANRLNDLTDELRMVLDSLQYIIDDAADAVTHEDTEGSQPTRRELRDAADAVTRAEEAAERAVDELLRVEDSLENAERHIETPAETRVRQARRTTKSKMVGRRARRTSRRK